MKPNYVAKKSVVCALDFWLILFFWLIIPLVIQIVRILQVKKEVIEFYDERIVRKWGLINKQEKQSVFAGVYSVEMTIPFWGMIFGYGNINVDCPGTWDISTRGIKNPKELKSYLESKITSRGIHKILSNSDGNFDFN